MDWETRRDNRCAQAPQNYWTRLFPERRGKADRLDPCGIRRPREGHGPGHPSATAKVEGEARREPAPADFLLWQIAPHVAAPGDAHTRPQKYRPEQEPCSKPARQPLRQSLRPQRAQERITTTRE